MSNTLSFKLLSANRLQKWCELTVLKYQGGNKDHYLFETGILMDRTILVQRQTLTHHCFMQTLTLNSLTNNATLP